MFFCYSASMLFDFTIYVLPSCTVNEVECIPALSRQLSLLPSAGREMIVAYGLRGEGLVWLIRAVVCLLSADRGSNCSLTRAMDGRIVRCGIIRSCQSAATCEIVKRFWSRTRVRSAITSIAAFTFTFALKTFVAFSSKESLMSGTICRLQLILLLCQLLRVH